MSQDELWSGSRGAGCIVQSLDTNTHLLSAAAVISFLGTMIKESLVTMMDSKGHVWTTLEPCHCPCHTAVRVLYLVLVTCPHTVQ